MSDSRFDCVRERPRPFADSGPSEVWHIAKSRGRTADFIPIRCSKDEGITMPGYIERRLPTCPDCLAIIHKALEGEGK